MRTHQFAILLLLSMQLLGAQSPSPMIADPQFGFTFSIPAGYQTQKEALGYLVAKPGAPGVALVVRLPETSLPKLRQAAAEGFLLGEAIQLRPAGELRTLTRNSFASEMTGTIQGTPVRAYSVVLAGASQTAYVISAAPVAEFSATHTHLVESIVQSVQFGPARQTEAPAASAPVSRPTSKDPAVSMWDQRLRGRMLHYFSRYNSSSGGSYSGYSEHKTIGLCADGTYLFNGEFSGSINVPGATASMNDPSRDAGRWSLVSRNGAVYLVLGGESIPLTTDGSKTFLNGTRWLVDDRGGCR